MIYFLALLPATALTIAGYFVLFLAARSEGSLRTFGRYLGFWAFTLAGLVVLGAIFAAAHGRHHYCPYLDAHGMHPRLYGPLPEGHPPLAPPGERPESGSPDERPPPAPADSAAPPRHPAPSG
jgi:hypothetical protein